MSDLPVAELSSSPAGPPKRALGIIFLIVFLDFLGFGVIIPLLPVYARQFQASPLQVTLLFSIYSACQFLASPILGAVSDRVGRRPVLILSQLGSAAGYVLLGLVTQDTALAPGMALWLVYLSRIIDGISGGNISTAQAYIADITSSQNRAKGMGLLGVAFGLGFSAGPALGGLFGAHSVYWPAYIAAALAGAAALLSALWLPESRVQGPAASEVWLHPRQFGAVLKRPVLTHLLLISFVCMAAFIMMEASLVMFLQDRFGFGPRYASFFFVFLGIVIIVVQGGLIGRLNKVLGEWPLAILGPAMVAVGMGLFVWAGFHPLLGVLVLGGFFNSAGRSLWQPTFSALLSHHSDEREQGMVFGLFHGLGGIARIVGPIVAGLVYETKLGIGPFRTAAGMLVAAAVWTLWVKLRLERWQAQPRGFAVAPLRGGD